ncbi:hypothetical protein CK203_064183 [Vitis vinifera]|uniref:Uncharacterized protein n=1 Tax=Vitis vinifera TaxID=29760 RepID=A0A438FR35_VITVI|nr:hypothetical protein CK203_064183 [Vitis vinifera]
MILHGGRKLSNSTKIFTYYQAHGEMKDCDKVEECAHFFNLNRHDKNLSSFPIERPTWVHVQDNGLTSGIMEYMPLIIYKDRNTGTQIQPLSIGNLHSQGTSLQLN